MITDAQRQMMSRVLGKSQGKFLKRGARGVTVRALQLYLRDQGFDIKADGIFGKNTEDALRAMQSKAGLMADGRAGSKTLGTIRKSVDMPMPTPRPDMAAGEPSESSPADMPEDMTTGEVGEPAEVPPSDPIVEDRSMAPQAGADLPPPPTPAAPPMPPQQPPPAPPMADAGQMPPMADNGPASVDNNIWVDLIRSVNPEYLKNIVQPPPVGFQQFAPPAEGGDGLDPLRAGMIGKINARQLPDGMVPPPPGFQQFGPAEGSDGMDPLRAALIGSINARQPVATAMQEPSPDQQSQAKQQLIRALLMGQ